MENLTPSFIPGEIISSGTSLEIRAARPVTIEAVRDALVLQSAEKRLQADLHLKDETVIQISTQSFPPGPYDVLFRQLVDKEGRVLTDNSAVTFTIGALKGTVSSETAILHAVQLAVTDLSSERLPPNGKVPAGAKYIEIVKTINRQSHEMQVAAFDEDGASVDPDKDLLEMKTRRAEKYGSASVPLYQKLETAKDDEVLTLFILPVVDFNIRDYDRPERELTEPQSEELALLEKIGDRHLKSLAALGVEVKTYDRSAFVSVTTTAEKTKKILTADGIYYVDWDDPQKAADLAQSLNISNGAFAQTTFNLDGTGVNVATYEAGPQNLTNLSFKDRFTSTPDASSPTTHSQLTSAIIKNTSSGAIGYAPKCNHFSANSFSYDAFNWAIKEKSCTVLSQSFHDNQGEWYDSYIKDDWVKDETITAFPFPFISQAAGNQDAAGVVFDDPADEFVNHKGFNSFSVGNHDDSAGNIVSSSVFRNPKTTHGDRELPHISANGFDVRALGITTNNTGTSFAAPAVAGAAALLQERAPVLKSFPEGVRAILLASAGRKVGGSTWFKSVQNKIDQVDGSGALNVLPAVTIAGKRVFATAAPAQNAFAVGNLQPSAFPSNGINPNTFDIRAPKTGATPKLVNFKVAIAWNSVIGRANPFWTIDYLTMDINISIINVSTGQIVSFSNTFDNSHEIADFQGLEDTTFRIRIHKAKNPEGLPDERTQFGLAWRTFPFGGF